MQNWERLPNGIHDVIRAIAAFPCVKRIILFGSRARGDNQERSDIDLAVECPEASAQEWSRIGDIIESARTLLCIDVVRLEHAYPEFQQTILNEGIVLYEPK